MRAIFADAKIIRVNGVDIVVYCPTCKTHIRIVFGAEVCKCST